MTKIRVDTGGTFTDCWGSGKHIAESPSLVKVLSSGKLSVAVSEWLSPTSIKVTIPASWKTPQGFFVGFQILDHATVTAFDAAESIITSSAPLEASSSIELSTGEEAPIIGTRLLTGTALDTPFPKLDFRLATTRGTNALLERKGSPVAFFITKGFGDLLEIGDQRRPNLFALQHKKKQPLFSQVIEVEERIDCDGNVLTSLELPDTDPEKNGIKVAAVALLHSYRNPDHEQRLREHLLGQGFNHVSISSDLAPLIKILPRAETTVTNAYLQPVMQDFLDNIQSALGDGADFTTMTSAGGLESIATYCPKDALLSGPAGGVSGAAAIAEELGIEKILTFDMGGTSTDVARYDGDFLYQFEQKVGDAHLMSPALKIETVAAGGGSICYWSNGGLRVGPESAGADPGPACYGNGGPLTVTDVNLLLGRIDPANFGVPLFTESIEAARSCALTLQQSSGIPGSELDPDFLEGLLEIAVEQMADAIRTISIRDGVDPADYALLAFGGAGPLHACDIASRLGIREIIIPAEAGLLSAYGLDQAEIERFAEKQTNFILTDTPAELIDEVRSAALECLEKTGYKGSIRRTIAEMRWVGQDATLSIEIGGEGEIIEDFEEQYQQVFGYLPTGQRGIELVSLRAIAGTGLHPRKPKSGVGFQPMENQYSDESLKVINNDDSIKSIEDSASQTKNHGQDARSTTFCAHGPTGLGGESNPVGSKFLDRTTLHSGEKISGPVIIQDPFSTLFLKAGWEAHVAFNNSLILQQGRTVTKADTTQSTEVMRELFRHRFENTVLEMGAMLQRSAISTNVKERADFSCALLSEDGKLIANAPHIPVHLGALGLCVREVVKRLPLQAGDTAITNHPGAGGSHLPDVTLITPVFPPGRETPVAYVANRAHHAEIGGITPGSMPANAQSLAEEGVVIDPCYLIREGESRFDEIEEILTTALHPTRHLADNLADLNAQLAANLRGVEIMHSLMENHGADEIGRQLSGLSQQCAEALDQHLLASSFKEGAATERLDDGTEICVSIFVEEEQRLIFDFDGTSAAHLGNLNASPAIVRSAVLYILQLWTQSQLPLNEGMLAQVDIRLPHCFLNPEFGDVPERCPAVVGGNVETSQRVVDTMIKALQIQACSQGTMNNLIFGDNTFGYYETIAGGAGAGNGYDGASGLHTHMTNTAITDPEILENRYPVRLLRFSLRHNSGGKGKWNGGNGLIREFEFLEPLQVSLLTQHRKEHPFGMDGGENGETGIQLLGGESLPGNAWIETDIGDVLRIETPGGGAWGGIIRNTGEIKKSPDSA